MESNKRVLVAPLDWGLGHATRCIPVIRGLLGRNCEVVIASSGDALSLLRTEFPQLKAFELPGYKPVYPSRGSMVWKMALQLPKFIKTIAAEHFETEKIVQELGIDIVISDNRYGCFSKKVKSVFVTHQLHILMPERYRWLERRINRFNTAQIKQYEECWVPVANTSDSFIPELLAADPAIKLQPIGYLSRFEKKQVAKKYDILVICSGPEPQRTIFEAGIIAQLDSMSGNCLLVRGKPENDGPSVQVPENILVIDFMHADELNMAIEASDLIIARSGYSTVMDLARLNKRAIFIPTPGQTEQEYIARQLMQREIAYYMTQQHFDLQIALKESLKFNGFTNFEHDNLLLKNAIASIC